MKTGIAVARAFADQCIQLHDSWLLDHEMASMVKYWATDMENKVLSLYYFIFILIWHILYPRSLLIVYSFMVGWASCGRLPLPGPTLTPGCKPSMEVRETIAFN